MEGPESMEFHPPRMLATPFSHVKKCSQLVRRLHSLIATFRNRKTVRRPYFMLRSSGYSADIS